MKKETCRNILQQAVPLILGLICILIVSLNIGQPVSQASMSITAPLEFAGEYSRDGENWFPLDDSAELSALDGDLILRGRFNLDIPEGIRINYYRDHIAMEAYLNGELDYLDLAAWWINMGRDLEPSMCGKYWDYWYSPDITAQDEIVIHLYNWHSFGNKNAYREFLDSLRIGPDVDGILEHELQQYRTPFQAAGGFTIVVALMLLGAAVTAAVLRMPIGTLLCKLGWLAFFTGGFFFFDTIIPSYWSGLMALNTYGRQICMMFAVYWLGLCETEHLTEKRRKLAKAAMRVSLLLNCILILLSFTGVMVIYDTLPFWMLSQLVLCPLMLACCVWEICCGHKEHRIFLFSYVLLFVTVLLDLAGVCASIYSHGTCTKIAFFLLLILLFVRATINIIRNHQASIRAKQLEKELEDSRIATMLSQIQPHFIYNTLGTVEQLCKEQPEVASNLVHNFSLYLRGNFSELDHAAPILLSKEMEHVRHYVDIEHIRFPDMEVRFELNSDEFLLPALSIQPLVENAIKHGLMGLESGGTVTVSTYETDRDYCVSVVDDGVGFDTSILLDDREHIGIRNIRGRIEAMCGGTLTVESTPGKGTKAVITIPKEKERSEHP